MPTRRDALLAGVATAGTVALSSSVQAQVVGEHQGTSILVGSSDGRPDPAVRKQYLYIVQDPGASDHGVRYFSTFDSDQWVGPMPARFDRVDVVPRDVLSASTDDLRAGSSIFDSRREVTAWWDGDNYEFPTFVDNNDVKTTTETVSNTTTETEIYRVGIVASGLVVGRTYIARNFGKYSTDSSSSGFTLRVKIGPQGFDAQTGGTVVGSVSTVQENVSDAPFQSKSTFIVHDSGSSGSLSSHTEGRFNDTPNDDHATGTSIDTTTASEVVITVQWNEASTGNTVTSDMVYLQQQA